MTNVCSASILFLFDNKKKTERKDKLILFKSESFILFFIWWLNVLCFC